MIAETYTTGGVAEILQVSADTVRRHWPAWARASGFPRPLPMPTDSPRALLRWDKSAVDAWRQLRGGSSRGEGDGGASVDSVDWAAVARARGLALDRGQDPDTVTAH